MSEPRGLSIGEFVQFAPLQGLVIERDGAQGDRFARPLP